MNKALVLNSGGCDSSTAVSIAVNEYGSENVSTVSVFYGQRHSKELKCAQDISDYYQLKHYEIDLSNVMKYSDCSLLSSSTDTPPEMSYADQIAQNGEGKVSTYVPFRNGLMLSAVASLAMSIYPNDKVKIYLGAHADDAAGEAYADCSKSFTDAMNQAISIGTYNQCEVVAPFVEMTKSQVVEWGIKLGTPYELTTSCYYGREKACGKCGTCIDRINAFKANGVKDPVEYEVDIDWGNCKDIK